MQAAVGGSVVYPNLQEIADLFRSGINDTFNNTTGTGTGSGNQAGLIMPNSNPDLLVFMSSAIKDLYADLRNVGDPELIIDNYIVSGLPALTQQNPAVQVALGYMGFFDGYQWHSQWTLPISSVKTLAVWERQTGSNLDFIPMKPAPFGLQSGLQGDRMNMWEMRQGKLWMPGCLQQTDLRIRARIGFPTPLGSNINFSTAYVPILSCTNAIVAKMLIKYAIRFAPEQYQMAIAEEAREMGKLTLEVVRQLQANENQRSPFGDDAVQDFAIAWAWL